jgi:membrane fusion protein, multidrug efflux system
VPVKIVLDDQRLKGLLRPGMSAVPTVDTKATVLAERETQARLASDTALTHRPNGGSCPLKTINPRLTILSHFPGLSRPAA